MYENLILKLKMQFTEFLSQLTVQSINGNDFELIQSFCDSLTFGIYIRDLESYKFIFINEKLANILGYQKSELIGTNLFMQQSSSISYSNDIILKLKERTDRLQKVKTKNKKGDIITLLHSFNIIKCENGKNYSLGTLIAPQNLEERKTISFFSKNFDFEDLFELIKVPIALINKNLKQITYANSALHDYLRIKDVENYLVKINSLCYKNDFFRNNYEIFTNENLNFYEFYSDILDNEGNSNPSICILNQFPDFEFDLLFMHPVVSNSVDVQNSLTSQRTQEIGENLIKSNFLTLVSHEFRTPLTKILLATDLLMNYEDKMNREEKLGRLNDIKDTIYGMTKLMEAVLTISRMEQNLYKPEFEFIDLRVFFEMILDGFLVRNNKGILYNFHFDSIHRFVSIEMTLVTLIANNIIDNATKFAKPDTSINIIVSIDSNSTILIEVKDEGIGIPKNEIEMVCNSFFKASNNRNYEGYGLGLFIVKKSIELLKGEIIIISEPDVGTTVRVSIPRPVQSK